MKKRKGPAKWQDPTALLEHEVSKDSRERKEDTSILGRNAENEALRNIISKLSEERNLRDLHLMKHYHNSRRGRLTGIFLEIFKTSIDTW